MVAIFAVLIWSFIICRRYYYNLSKYWWFKCNVEICNKFAIENEIIFNQKKKSVLIKFGEKLREEEHAIFGWVLSYEDTRLSQKQINHATFISY